MSARSYFLIVDDVEYSFYSELDFQDESNEYIHARRVQCDGKMRDTGDIFLIDGLEPTEGLECSVTIEEGDPWVLPDAPACQMQMVEKFSRSALISKVIGNIGYENGLKDRRLPQGLYASVCLNKAAFADMWNCVLAGRQLKSIHIDIFGSAMLKTEISYNWRITKEDKDLFICGFGFRAR